MVAASICWSLGGVCIKFIPWSAMSIISMRAALAAVVFAIYRRSVKVQLTKGNVMAAVCLASTTILFVFANRLTTAAAAIVLQFSSPVFILFINYIFYRKRPRLSELLAVFVTTAGIVLFFADQLDAGHLLGNILAIASGLSFAGVLVCNKRPDTDPQQSVMLGFFINAVIWLPFVFLDSSITADAAACGLILVLGVVQVGLAYVFFTVGIKHTQPLPACLITALEPVLSPIWVALATDEMPGRFALIGGVIILCSIIAYNAWEARAGRKVES